MHVCGLTATINKHLIKRLVVVWSANIQFKLVMVEEDFEDEYINIHVHVFVE